MDPQHWRVHIWEGSARADGEIKWGRENQSYQTAVVVMSFQMRIIYTALSAFLFFFSSLLWLPLSFIFISMYKICVNPMFCYRLAWEMVKHRFLGMQWRVLCKKKLVGLQPLQKIATFQENYNALASDVFFNTSWIHVWLHKTLLMGLLASSSNRSVYIHRKTRERERERQRQRQRHWGRNPEAAE